MELVFKFSEGINFAKPIYKTAFKALDIVASNSQ